MIGLLSQGRPTIFGNESHFTFWRIRSLDTKLNKIMSKNRYRFFIRVRIPAGQISGDFSRLQPNWMVGFWQPYD